ncbi:hypothetical protein LSAT2_031860, partial [Lamellibrachia satsuma]
MCEPDGQGGWIPYNMTCPACTFWDQDKLSCVEVYQDLDHTGVCGNFTEVTGVTIPTHDERRKLFCINFEYENNLADNGVYVYNDGVELLTDNSLCPIVESGHKCGHFLGKNSRLEVPFFSNNYDSFKSLQITFYYRKTGTGTNMQGIISNDCYPDATVPYAAGNSLYCAAQGSMFYGGMKEPTADVSVDTWTAPVVFVDMRWDGNDLSVALFGNTPDGPPLNTPVLVPFKGPIRNSHCPLVIGSFIKEAMDSFFEGTMDDVNLLLQMACVAGEIATWEMKVYQ